MILQKTIRLSSCDGFQEKSDLAPPYLLVVLGTEPRVVNFHLILFFFNYFYIVEVAGGAVCGAGPLTKCWWPKRCWFDCNASSTRLLQSSALGPVSRVVFYEIETAQYRHSQLFQHSSGSQLLRRHYWEDMTSVYWYRLTSAVVYNTVDRATETQDQPIIGMVLL